MPCPLMNPSILLFHLGRFEHLTTKLFVVIFIAVTIFSNGPYQMQFGVRISSIEVRKTKAMPHYATLYLQQNLQQ